MVSMSPTPAIDSALIGLEAQIVLAEADPEASQHTRGWLKGYRFALRQLSSKGLITEDAWGLRLVPESAEGSR